MVEVAGTVVEVVEVVKVVEDVKNVEVEEEPNIAYLGRMASGGDHQSLLHRLPYCTAAVTSDGMELVSFMDDPSLGAPWQSMFRSEEDVRM